MAMTQTALLALGAFATLATIGMFLDFDDWTQALVGLVASVTWALVSLSSFSVLLPGHRPEATTVTLTPLVWLAAGFALTTFLFTLWGLLQGVRDEASSANMDAFR